MPINSPHGNMLIKASIFDCFDWRQLPGCHQRILPNNPNHPPWRSHFEFRSEHSIFVFIIYLIRFTPSPIHIPDTMASNGGKPVTAETLGHMDVSQLDESHWLIKIPTTLAEAFSKVPAGTVLGELIFTKGGKLPSKTVKPSLKVRVEESLVTDIPVQYELEAMTKRVPVMHPFVRHADGGVQVLGTVTRTANLQASREDARFRALCKQRLLETSVNNTRFVKSVEATELSVRKAVPLNKGFGSAVQKFGERLKEQEHADDVGDESRKRKYEEIPARSVLFELFQYRAHWTMKEIRQESGKPEKELRVILNEIGSYHRSGEHKNMWSLKSEFNSGGQGTGGGDNANA
jgi:hypothetical protein